VQNGRLIHEHAQLQHAHPDAAYYEVADRFHGAANDSSDQAEPSGHSGVGAEESLSGLSAARVLTMAASAGTDWKVYLTALSHSAGLEQSSVCHSVMSCWSLANLFICLCCLYAVLSADFAICALSYVSVHLHVCLSVCQWLLPTGDDMIIGSVQSMLSEPITAFLLLAPIG